MRVTACRSCGAPIVWIKTRAGKSMPCDAQLVSFVQQEGGPAKIVTPEGEVVSGRPAKRGEPFISQGYIPHWSTCNAPDSFRKKGAKAR